MRLFSWLRDRTGGSALAHAGHARRQTARTRPATRRLRLEQLEDRLCPSSYSITDLGILPGQYTPIPSGINNYGQVVGYDNDSAGKDHGFLWTPTTPNGTSGSMIDLGSLGYPICKAFGINRSGQVVGESSTASTTANFYTEDRPRDTRTSRTRARRHRARPGGAPTGRLKVSAAYFLGKHACFLESVENVRRELTRCHVRDLPRRQLADRVPARHLHF